FGEAFIYIQSLLGGVSGQWQRFPGLLKMVTAERRVGVGQSDISQRIPAVSFDGMLIGLDAFTHAFGGALCPVVTALEVKLIGFGVLRVAFGQLALLVAAQTQLQRVGYLARNLLLHGQQVGERALIPLAPELRAGGGVHQLNVDDQPIAQALSAAGDHRPHLERLAHLTRINFAPFVSEDNAARHHSAQRGQSRQTADQILGDTVRQVFHLWVGAHIGKGQHRDRINRSAARREPLPPIYRRQKRQRERRQRQAYAVTQSQAAQYGEPRGPRRDSLAHGERRLFGALARGERRLFGALACGERRLFYDLRRRANRKHEDVFLAP